MESAQYFPNASEDKIEADPNRKSLNNQIMKQINKCSIVEEDKESVSELNSDKVLVDSKNSSPGIWKDSKCSCKPSILVVDDTDFNLLALKTVITEVYKIVPDEA